MGKNTFLAKYYKNRIGFTKTITDEDKQEFNEFSDYLYNTFNPDSIVEFAPINSIILNYFAKQGKDVCAINDNFFNYDVELDKDIVEKTCRSLFTTLTKRKLGCFDLAIILGILEYFTPAKAEKFLKTICSCCNTVVLYFEKRNYNKKDLSYWTKIFFDNGFARDLVTNCNYVGVYVFKKLDASISDVVGNYDSQLNDCTKEFDLSQEINSEERKEETENFLLQIKELKEKNDMLRRRVKSDNYKISKLQSKLDELDESEEDIDTVEDESENEDADKTDPDKKNKKDTAKKERSKGVAKDPNKAELDATFVGKSLDVAWFMNSNEALVQREKPVLANIKFSILTVLTFESKEQNLTEMFDSVLNQTYTNWEMCIVDATNNEQVKKICESYSSKYQNIKVKQDDSSNSDLFALAYKMSTGSVISLLYQGDIIHPSALYETVDKFTKYSADFTYSDEASCEYNIISPTESFYKPEFSPLTLRYVNYVNTFASFDKNLLDSVGGFDAKLETSNHYDLMLRLTENAKRIEHIQKILYYKRGLNHSWTENSETVISEHLKKLKINAKVEKNLKYPDVYSIDYRLEKEPKVSIVISNIGDMLVLKRCVDFLMKTNYSNYDIIIVNMPSYLKENIVFDRNLRDNLPKLQYLFEKYDAYLEENSLLTQYNRRFTEIEKKEFEAELKNFQNRISNADKAIKKEFEKNNKIKYLQWTGKYNRAEMENYASAESDAEYCVFLDVSAVIKSKDWLKNMVVLAESRNVGIVGAKILNGYGRIKGMGVTFSSDELCRDLYNGYPEDDAGYNGGLLYPNINSCVSDGCVMVKRKDFDDIGRLAMNLPTYYLYKDLCLRYREDGFDIISTPFAEIMLCGSYITDEIKFKNAPISLIEETDKFIYLEGSAFNQDPFYNVNFTRKGITFEEDMDKLDHHLCFEYLD